MVRYQMACGGDNSIVKGFQKHQTANLLLNDFVGQTAERIGPQRRFVDAGPPVVRHYEVAPGGAVVVRQLCHERGGDMSKRVCSSRSKVVRYRRSK